MLPSDVRKIYACHSRRIPGWFFKEAAMLFGVIDEVQKSNGVEGHLFEIGVHRGRSAVLLASMARPGERLGICDLFGGQDLNTSRSGVGDRGICEANIRRTGFDRLDVFEQSSADVASGEITQPVRIFHVDGGHFLEEAYGDLELGRSVLHEDGVIFLDDPLRVEWPGVTEAVLAFLSAHEDFVPLALGFNKLALTRQAAAVKYQAALEADGWIDRRVYARKVLPFAGRDIPIFYIPYKRRIPELDRLVARMLANSRVSRLIASPRRAEPFK